MDVLTHAIEAYVSTMASDYTDALAEKAIKLVFKYLKKAYENGNNDPEAREKMHNASCIAGMAFTNAFLGLNHSMAHKLGGEFHIPHGRANAILLPYVIKYNASLPSKFAAFPKYESYKADKRYAEIAEMIGVSGKDTLQSVDNLIESIKKMNEFLNIPISLKEYGISEKEFLNKVGYDLGNIKNELEKLFILTNNEKIEEEDIKSINTNNKEESLFSLIDSIVNKEISKSIKLYRYFIDKNEEVIKIIAMLANKYRLIYQTKLLYQEGKNKYDISKILGVHSYAISLAITTSFKYTDSELIRILKELYNLDLDIKIGKVNDKFALEMFILKNSKD